VAHLYQQVCHNRNTNLTTYVVVPCDKVKVSLSLLHHLYTVGNNDPEMMSNIITDSSLMTRTEMVLATLVYSPFNHLTWLLAREHFIEFSYWESFKLCITNKSYDKQCIPFVVVKF